MAKTIFGHISNIENMMGLVILLYFSYLFDKALLLVFNKRVITFFIDMFVALALSRLNFHKTLSIYAG